MENVIIVVILAAIAGSIIWYLLKAKRRGDVCIGCPHSKQCGGKCGGCSDGCTHKKSDESSK